MLDCCFSASILSGLQSWRCLPCLLTTSLPQTSLRECALGTGPPVHRPHAVHAVGQAISSGPLAAIGDTLTPVLAALRMVWVISRHYSDDEGMSALLQRVAFAIAERCRDAIDLKVRLSGKDAYDAQPYFSSAHAYCMRPGILHGTLCVMLRLFSNANLPTHNGCIWAVWISDMSKNLRWPITDIKNGCCH